MWEYCFQILSRVRLFLSNNVKIKVLDGLVHVQTRPEMYIGSTYNYAHLITEILDNALDELANKFATVVQIKVSDESVVEIMDNGRGIPIHSVDDFEHDSVVAAASKLFSGAKFDDKAYDISIGLHGVGLAVTNALSTFLEIRISHGKLVNSYRFEYSQYKGMAQRARLDTDPSTYIAFQPNKKYFSTLKVNLEPIRKRLYLIGARVPGSSLYMNGEKIPSVSMDELARYYLGLEESTYLTYTKIERQAENATVYVTYDTDRTIVGDINLNICTGTYLTTITTIFTKCVQSKYPQLTKSNITNGLNIYCSAFIKDPRFEGQVKNKMVKDITPFLQLLNQRFDSMINTPFFTEYFEAVVESKVNAAASKKLKRTAMVGQGNPLKDCINRPGDVMYILEGDSAGNAVKKFRNKRTEAIFPLSGKILNTVKKNISDALDSKKMKYLLEAIGVDVSKKHTNYRYKEFKILADADCDGGHIAVLVLLALYRFAPEIIKQGKLKIILPPLYGTYVNKQFIPIYDDTELAKYRSDGHEIMRFKGLGEMQSEQLEVVVRSGKYEYLVKYPKTKDIESAIITCITDTEAKRHLCNNIDLYNISRIFDAI